MHRMIMQARALLVLGAVFANCVSPAPARAPRKNIECHWWSMTQHTRPKFSALVVTHGMQATERLHQACYGNEPVLALVSMYTPSGRLNGWSEMVMHGDPHADMVDGKHKHAGMASKLDVDMRWCLRQSCHCPSESLCHGIQGPHQNAASCNQQCTAHDILSNGKCTD